MKVAVIFYSFEGNTKKIATEIAEEFNADIFELKVVRNTVPKGGFMKFFWGGKQVFMKEKPELEEIDIKIDDYDLIFIGTPVWSFTYSPAIRSFFSKYEIKGKKIGLFCSHSGGLKNTMQDLKSCLPENEFITEFDIIDPLKNQVESEQKIEAWINSIKK